MYVYLYVYPWLVTIYLCVHEYVLTLTYSCTNWLIAVSNAVTV